MGDKNASHNLTRSGTNISERRDISIPFLCRAACQPGVPKLDTVGFVDCVGRIRNYKNLFFLKS
jgi:hypothetical protein